MSIDFNIGCLNMVDLHRDGSDLCGLRGLVVNKTKLLVTCGIAHDKHTDVVMMVA